MGLIDFLQDGNLIEPSGELKANVVAVITVNIDDTQSLRAHGPINKGGVDGVKISLQDAIDQLGSRAFTKPIDFGQDSEERALTDEQMKMLDEWVDFVKDARNHVQGEELTVVGVCNKGKNRSGLFAGWTMKSIDGSVDTDHEVMPTTTFYQAIINKGRLDVDPALAKQESRKRRRS
jgi:hypothetical protein